MSVDGHGAEVYAGFMIADGGAACSWLLVSLFASENGSGEQQEIKGPREKKALYRNANPPRTVSAVAARR